MWDATSPESLHLPARRFSTSVPVAQSHPRIGRLLLASEVLTAGRLAYGSPQAVADVLSGGDDPAEQLESIALEGLDDGFAHFTLRSVISIDDGAAWLTDVISNEPVSIELAHSAIRFALHRRRCFEGHSDPGFLVLAYYLAHAVGGGVFNTESIDAVIEDVQIPPGTYKTVVR